MKNFEYDRKRFLSEALGETDDCSEVDIVIALQNQVRTYDDLCEVLNLYDEWSVNYEIALAESEGPETFVDKLHGQAYLVGDDLDLYIGEKLMEVRYIGMMPVHEGIRRVGKGTLVPTFWSKDGSSILYLTENSKEKLDFSVVFLSKNNGIR